MGESVISEISWEELGREVVAVDQSTSGLQTDGKMEGARRRGGFPFVKASRPCLKISGAEGVEGAG